MDARVTSHGPILFLACATLGGVEAMAAQEEPADASPWPRDDARPVSCVTLEGFVLAPDGSPVEGAVVVSSAGGKALTDVAGNYRLEIDVPRDATSVQVTAVGAGRNLAASASVAVSAAGAARVDPLVLAIGDSCSPGWLPTFGGRPGTLGSTSALTVYDDGDGPALYAGGEFSSAGGVAANRIAKWDGSSWSTLGGGIGGTSDVRVMALAVHDDGNGSALYAGGRFQTAGGVGASGIAKWDGLAWSPLGSGMSGLPINSVVALAVYDDGSGPALYAGGVFTSAGGVAANRIAKWDGSSWTALGGGVSGQQGCCPGSVSALTVYDDGSGPALYAGGNFTAAGGVTVNHIAKWDGSSWAALSSGVSGQGLFNDPVPVTGLTVYDDGSGPALYAGGSFTSAGGVAANRIAKWDGSSWTPLGSGMNSPVHSLTVYDDGVGPALYAGGSFSTAGGAAASTVAKWDGSGWSPLASGMFGDVGALMVHDDGSGAALFAGGSFTTADGLVANNIARWEGSSWTALGSGMDDHVAALTVHDDGNGPALYAGGSFRSAGGVAANYIARWDGSSWSPLGSGMGGDVRALAVYDDGSGPALYAGGSVQILKWNGSTWEPLRMGLLGVVYALAVFDDGSGPVLVAGGDFTWTGGYLVVNNVASWDGERWRRLGSGTNSAVTALAVHDDGSGPALYAGGLFTTAGGATANKIAKWDGSSWTEPGSGMNDEVHALAVYDDGNGPALYAGGKFTFVSGGFTASRVAKWDGTRWRALGSGTDHWVHALAAHDDGSGPALYAGGRFGSAGGVAANRIARWNGSEWSALGSGLTGMVRALAVHDDGGGPALFAGGGFVVGGDSYLAKWGHPVDLDPPELSCPASVLVLDDLGGPPGESVSFSVTASDCRDPSPLVVCVPPSGSFFPRGTTVVTCTAMDSAGNQSTCEFPVTVERKARRR